MPIVVASSSRLEYKVHGAGEPVLLLPPAATHSTVWLDHQIPALVDAGYGVITLDHRGTPPAPAPMGSVRIGELAADAIELIEQLDMRPCRIVGASLGAMVAQELAVRRPDLVDALVLMATRCRTDYFRAALGRAQAAKARASTTSDYDALAHLLWLFSPRTLVDERRTADWFTLVRTFPVLGLGPAAQFEATIIPDQTEALHGVDRPCLVVAFADDLITPPDLCREVASAIAGSRYVIIPDCGHFGFLERPDAVNTAVLEFLTETSER